VCEGLCLSAWAQNCLLAYSTSTAAHLRTGQPGGSLRCQPEIRRTGSQEGVQGQLTQALFSIENLEALKLCE
jgi:hypothetical protein